MKESINQLESKPIISKPKQIRPQSSMMAFNKTSKLSLQQSPKITSGKFRTGLHIDTTNVYNPRNQLLTKATTKVPKKKLFSLLDVNDKITNKRGPDMPMQFKRRSCEEVNHLMTLQSKPNKSCKMPQIALKTEEDIIKEEYNKELIKVLPKSREFRLYSANFHIKKYQRMIDSKLGGEQKNKENKENQKDVNQKKDEKKRDALMPEFYEEYKELVKKPKMIIEDFRENYKFFNDKFYNISPKEIKMKAHQSDIFNKKPLEPGDKEKKVGVPKMDKNLNSDIFYLKTNPSEYEKKKSGEKYFFYPISTNAKFTCANESGSNWAGYRDKLDKNVNTSKTNYNILVPGTKPIIDNKNISKNYHVFKGFSEFRDLTRVTAPGLNNEYQRFVKEGGNFKKTHGMCSDYYDSYNVGRILYYCKPFRDRDIGNGKEIDDGKK